MVSLRVIGRRVSQLAPSSKLSAQYLLRAIIKRSRSQNRKSQSVQNSGPDTYDASRWYTPVIEKFPPAESVMYVTL
eukprot:COSAG01_NODE_1300_length_10830_cov_25.036716_2_plen_76_part_00